MTAPRFEPRPTGSASDLAARMGDALPGAESFTAEQAALVDVVRRLLDGVVVTDVDDAERVRLTADLERIVDALGARTRDPLIRLVRHPDGRFENLTQAGTGRANPRAIPVAFDDLTVGPAITAGPGPEVRGRCVLGAAAGGPPERAHGGVVAALLDESLGAALVAAGRLGMTVALEVDYLAGVPLGVPLELRSRCTGVEGRKTRLSAEIVVDGSVVARGRALFVASRPDA